MLCDFVCRLAGGVIDGLWHTKALLGVRRLKPLKPSLDSGDDHVRKHICENIVPVNAILDEFLLGQGDRLLNELCIPYLTKMVSVDTR